MQKQSKQLVLYRKKAHFDQIISISVHPTKHNLIATSSEDQTVRIWDLRLNSSIKLIKNPQLNQQLSNCVFTQQQQIFLGCGKNVYSFDARKQNIFIKESTNKSKEHYDEINHIATDKSYQLIAACDDQGDTKIYNTNLQIKYNLDQKHKNISFCTQFIYPQNYKLPVCVTTGFDTNIVYWNLENSQPFKQINLTQLLKKYTQTFCPPLIRCIQPQKSSILVGTQTGHVINLGINEKKPKFLLQASLSKIVRMTFCKFDANILLTLASDESFSMFSYVNRDLYNNPKIIQKYKTSYEANWIQTTAENKILVGDKSQYLSIFTVKS